MNSRELGLVNTAFNSLLGTMSTQSTQQVSSEKTFNKIFDNKLQYADKKIGQVQKSSQYEKVNREEVSAKNYEQENERDAFVKSDMQKPKKAITKASSESKDVIKDEKAIDTKNADPTKEAKAIESEEVEGVVDDVQKVEDNDVVKELMMLLGNDQLSDQEKTDQINLFLSELTSDQLGSLENVMGDLKIALLSMNGSLKDFEQTLSKLSMENSSFSNVLEGLEQTEVDEILPQKTELETANVPQLTKTSEESAMSNEKIVDVDTALTKEAVEVVEELAPKLQVEEKPKETKAELLKAAEESADKTLVVEGVNAESSSSQSNQQQSNSETNQSFAESLKFHTADVKTAAMKGTVTTNPFEEKIMQQIIKGTEVSMKVGKDVSEMMIKLNPKDLGNVSLKISLKNEQLVAEFSVENKTVKEVLESRLDDLRMALSDKGFTVEGMDVSVDQDENDQFRSYEEFLKQQKDKKKFSGDDEIVGIEGVNNLQEESLISKTLETTSSEINTLA